MDDFPITLSAPTDAWTWRRIRQSGLSTAVRRAFLERLVWDEPAFVARRMNSQTADLVTVAFSEIWSPQTIEVYVV